jgi:hypothetical protein
VAKDFRVPRRIGFSCGKQNGKENQKVDADKTRVSSLDDNQSQERSWAVSSSVVTNGSSGATK